MRIDSRRIILYDQIIFLVLKLTPW